MKKIIIETPRLILRELTEQDAGYFYLLNLDPEVIQHTGDFPFESIDSARFFLKNYAPYREYGYGRWAVVLKNKNEWLGWCGLRYDIKNGDTDIGYRFFKKYWGNGYASESAAASIKYGFEKLGLDRIIGRALKKNKASVRIFEKTGMNYVEDIKMNGEAAVLYEIIYVE